MVYDRDCIPSVSISCAISSRFRTVGLLIRPTIWELVLLHVVQLTDYAANFLRASMPSSSNRMPNHSDIAVALNVFS